MKKRLVAIKGGGDWMDASVDHLNVPEDMDLDAEHKAWRKWYNEEYCGHVGDVKYISFIDWAKNNGAESVTVEEYWD